MGLFDRKTKRTHALQEYADRNGHAFQWKDEFGLVKYFGDLKLFQRGHSRRARNIRRMAKDQYGEYGHFDYSYVISTGNSHQVFRQTVYYRIDKSLLLPQFHMFPERWYHQVGKWFGMQDINFMAYPKFSKAYLLQGEQEGFVRDLFEDRSLIRHFKIHRNWSIEAVGYYFVMYHNRKLQRVPDLSKFVRTGNTLHRLLTERSAALQTRSQDFNLSE
ncbi:MAG: hypothetical protein R3301_09415 [Saprospiraceae bacterium]|nr:hypothetical protein [Saprospiraceae bacterium]